MDELRALEPIKTDLVILPGGPIGAYEEDRFLFLSDELRILEARLKEDLPTLGICLSTQLIARSLGEKVFPHRLARPDRPALRRTS